MPQSLFQKVWDAHTVRQLANGQTQLLIGTHLIHEVTSPQAFGMLREMNEGERFVLLACDSACAAHRSGEGLVASLPAALQFLESLRPGGSSDTAGALLSAAAHLRLFGRSEGRRKQVVFLSDGQTSSGELTPETISARV